MKAKFWMCIVGASLVLMPFNVPADTLSATVIIDSSPNGREQTIDGFGTSLYGSEAQQPWFQHIYFDDLRSSILRFDITPRFRAPYSDLHYVSPWFGQAAPLDLPGPDGNNVRTYTGPADYSRIFGGRRAAIAVMGPDIDRNVQYFDFGAEEPKTAGLMAQLGERKKAELGDFKLVASMWSPAPWLKLSSGNRIHAQTGALPKNGTPWPFIWGGNFAGGRLDTSGIPRTEFDDRAVGGKGPTSALTQFARGLAAYLRGFQDAFHVKFYAVSLQNEIGFEEYYSSCEYPRSDGYIKALKAARAELNRYPDLTSIRIMGPEDVLGGDGYGMWQYGSHLRPTEKNLQLLAHITRNAGAAEALAFFCIHSYAANGVTSSGGDPTPWEWWRRGWTASPAKGLPSNVKGFTSYGKKSWMTESSGECTGWLCPSNGFPGRGAWSIGLKIEQALTVGRESAWLYWQLATDEPVSGATLTDRNIRNRSPKYVAAKHFFRYIRPGAVRVRTTVQGPADLLASAYVHDTDRTLVIELVNASPEAVSAHIIRPAHSLERLRFEVVTSSQGRLWQSSTTDEIAGRLAVVVPGYGIVTLHAVASMRTHQRR